MGPSVITTAGTSQDMASQAVASQAVVAPISVVEPMLIVEQKETTLLQTQPKIVRPGEGTLWSAFGDSIRALLSAEDTGGEIFVGHMEPPAGYGPPLHVHLKEDEIFIVEQGSFEFTIRNQVVQVGPGTVVYGPRNIPHTWRSVGEGLNRATVISVPANFGVFFGRCAEAFAKGEPDMAEVMRIADEHGLLFVSPEQAAVYPEPTDPNVPQPKIVKQDEGLRIGSKGERGRGILMSGETNGQFLLVEVEVEPGYGPPPHVHTREDEVFLIQSGQIEFWIDGTVTQAGPGTVVFAPRNVPHTFRGVGEGTARAIVVVTPGALEQFFMRREELQQSGQLDEQKLLNLAAEYGLHIVSPRQ
jgi:mannose-6-phosphate isomerase-like protein (cupin superfamily)